MVQAVVNISERANRVLNIVKAKYTLKDKSQAIDVMAYAYEEELLEPELKPEFAANLQRIQRGPFKRINSLNELLR